MEFKATRGLVWKKVTTIFEKRSDGAAKRKKVTTIFEKRSDGAVKKAKDHHYFQKAKRRSCNKEERSLLHCGIDGDQRRRRTKGHSFCAGSNNVRISVKVLKIETVWIKYH